MILNFKVPVDAGCIVLIDGGEIKDYLGDDPTRLKISEAEDTFEIQKAPARVKFSPGFYTVNYKISHWGGEDLKFTRLQIPSGNLIVADLCHIVDPYRWNEFLETTDCLKTFPNPTRAHVIDTGGDGAFHLNINIRPMEEKK